MAQGFSSILLHCMSAKMTCDCPCSDPKKMIMLETDIKKTKWIRCSCAMCGPPKSKGTRCNVLVMPGLSLCGNCCDNAHWRNRFSKRWVEQTHRESGDKEEPKRAKVS